MNGISVGSKSVKIADVVPRSLNRKAKLAVPLPGSAVDTEDENIEDGSTLDGSVPKGRTARDVVTPLAHMTYEDQLEHKKNSLAQMLKKLVSDTCFVFTFLL